MSMLDDLAQAIDTASKVRAYGLYDYSQYPGDAPPHVVRDEMNGSREVFRSEDDIEARHVYERLSRQYVARAALQAIRELPLEVQKTIFDDRDGFVHELDIPKVWTFGIDAILNPGTET